MIFYETIVTSLISQTEMDVQIDLLSRHLSRRSTFVRNPSFEINALEVLGSTKFTYKLCVGPILKIDF